MSFLISILIALGLGFLLSETLKKFGVPRVVGQVFAGIIIAAVGMKEIFFTGPDMEIIKAFAETGELLVFFFVGLEMNLRAVRKNVKESVTVSVFSTLLPFLTGVILGKLLGFDFIVGIVLGISFSVSSQGITFELLEEFRLLKSRVGNVIVSAGAMDDLIEFIIISIMLTAIQVASEGGIITAVANVLIFLVLIILLKAFILPPLLKLFEQEKSQAALLTGAIFITLTMAILAQNFGISGLLGAFLAGILVRHMLLSETHRKPWEEHQISNAVHVLAFGFLLPIFFVWIGINTSLSISSSDIILLAILLTMGSVWTVIGSVIGVLLTRGNLKEGILVGLGVTPKGDVELAVAALALEEGIITNSLYSLIVLMAIGTSLFSPIIFRYFAAKWHKHIA